MGKEDYAEPDPAGSQVRPAPLRETAPRGALPGASDGIFWDPACKMHEDPWSGSPRENSAAFRRYRAGLLAVRSEARGEGTLSPRPVESGEEREGLRPPRGSMA